MSSFSDSPDAIDALLEMSEAEGSEGTSSTPPPAPEAPEGQQSQQAQTANQPAAKATGTTEQKPLDAAATAPQPPAQSPLPKELEAFKPLIESKKWDVSKSDWIAQPLKSLQEAEQFNGRITTDLGMTRTRVSEIEQALLGTPDQINAHREIAGLPPLPFEKSSSAEKLQAAEAEAAIFQRMLSQDPDESAKAIAEFQGKIQQKLEDLKFQTRFEKMAPKSQSSDIVGQQKTNLTALSTKYPDAMEKFNSLVPYLKTKLGTGVLGSFGMDLLNIHNSPERSNQMYELAAKIHLADNFEAEVDRRVKQALTDNLTRGNATAIQGQGATSHQQTPGDEDPAMEHLMAVQRR